jgi:hypothetical protein
MQEMFELAFKTPHFASKMQGEGFEPSQVLKPQDLKSCAFDQALPPLQKADVYAEGRI